MIHRPAFHAVGLAAILALSSVTGCTAEAPPEPASTERTVTSATDSTDATINDAGTAAEPAAHNEPAPVLSTPAVGVDPRTVALSTVNPTTAAPIVADGNTDDWGDAEYARITGDTVFVRVPVAMLSTFRDRAIRIDLDADANADTGLADNGLGVDMRIDRGQLNAEDRDRRGVLVYNAQGLPGLVSTVDLRLHYAPSYAADVFEVRFDRADVPALAQSTQALVRISSTDDSVAGGPLLARVAVPPATGDGLDVADVSIPTKPAGAVRVMSWNVLWGGPESTPDGFARVLAALQPDIILLQEWGRADATEDTVKAWFDEHAPWGESLSGATWSVSEHDAWGVAIATPHPIMGRAGDGLMAPGTRWNFPVRMAAASVDVDGTIIAAGSVHYKCCGALDTEEDIRRMVEADATNAAMRTLAQSTNAKLIVLGGDFNMNGTYAVMERSVAGLDTDGSANTVAQPFQLGLPILGTFGRPGDNTTAPRLDFITYPDAGVRAVNQFVLDTTRLNASALQRAGLRRLDTASSDHLPVVVDLLPN